MYFMYNRLDVSIMRIGSGSGAPPPANASVKKALLSLASPKYQDLPLPSVSYIPRPPQYVKLVAPYPVRSLILVSFPESELIRIPPLEELESNVNVPFTCNN